eukprot:TRINITY_DN2175_c0_g1_i2.p1 TRINITY_DN2175_c0_g1~~TRINITY_DN2175_c0_g1_i2.p1  ORF type:complete len:111 (+),score=2.91 TRINITY_DN2175_c0_g1_i2:216-548(+)
MGCMLALQIDVNFKPDRLTWKKKKEKKRKGKKKSSPQGESHLLTFHYIGQFFFFFFFFYYGPSKLPKQLVFFWGVLPSTPVFASPATRHILVRCLYNYCVLPARLRGLYQ